MNKTVRRLQKRFLKYLLPVVLLFTVLPVKNLCATGAMWQTIDYKSRIFINFCSNADRFPHDILFEYRHEIEALDYVKNTLVKEKKIKDIPILIILPRDFPGWGPGPIWIKPLGVEIGTQISIEHNGLLLQDEEDFSKIGLCYVIYIPRQEETYDKLLTLTLALQFLTPEKEKIKVSDISELKKSLKQDLARFSNISLRFDPVSSPDGKLVADTVWRDGTVNFELVSQTRKTVRRLEPLEGYVASLPLWSPDSRYLAYASLKEIKVFDSRANRTAAIPALELTRSSHEEITAAGEILLSFEKAAGELWFVLTPIHRMKWYVWKYSLKQKKATFIGQDSKKPEWLCMVDLESDGCIERLVFTPGSSNALSIWREDRKIWEGIPERWRPWKMEIADVDGDGIQEIIFGVYKKTRFFPNPHNCLFVFGWDGETVLSKWLGSSLSKPFTDFTFAELDGRKGAELVSLEVTSEADTCVVIYTWRGFGFSGVWQSEPLPGNWSLDKENNQVVIFNQDKKLILVPDGKVFLLKKAY